jgi:SOS-response transcriptional repressor LexA
MENRPSKKQRELLSFIDGFIKGNGYGPSYREIMRSLDYKSVSTVAVHVDGLIAKGFLRKKDNSARSLEVVLGNPTPPSTEPNEHFMWFQKEIKKREKDDSEKTKLEVEVLKKAFAILQDLQENFHLDQGRDKKV